MKEVKRQIAVLRKFALALAPRCRRCGAIATKRHSFDKICCMCKGCASRQLYPNDWEDVPYLEILAELQAQEQDS